VANDIGEVVVTVVADASQFEKDLTKTVEGGAKAAEPAAEKGGKGIGDALGRGLIATGKLVGAGLAAALGASLVAGFNRLKVIDQAEAKLLGLGNSAEEVVGIMDQALKSVEGTAFGLGEAADLAARFMAAGVEAGGELQLALDATADAAAVTGVSLADMGEIMGDIAADGELTGESLRRMSRAGIDAVDQLSDAYGVTREEAQRMVDEGEVSFEEFAQALEMNIGDASEKTADTFTGAMKNIGAAMARFGATILKPVFEGIIAIAPTVIAAINTITNAFKPIFEQIGPAVATAFDNIAAALAKIDWAAVGTAVAGMAAVIGASIRAVLPVIRALIDAFGPPLQLAIKAVTAVLNAMPWQAIIDLITKLGPPIAAAIVLFGGFQKVSKVIKGVQLAFGLLTKQVTLHTLVASKNATAVKLATVAQTVHTTATNLMAKATALATKAMKALSAAFKFMTGPIGLIIAGITAVVVALRWFFTETEVGRQMWETFVTFLQTSWQNFMGWIVPIIQQFAAFFMAIWDAITVHAMAIWEAFLGWFQPKLDAFLEVWTVVWEAVKAVFTTIWDFLVAFVVPIVEVIVSFIINRFQAMFEFWQTIWEAVRAVVEVVWNIITSIIQLAVALIIAIFTGDFSTVVDIINRIWEDVKAGTQRIWDSIIAWIREIPNKIKDIFSDAASWLVEAGRNVLQGFWNGLKSIWGNIESWFGDKIDGLVSKAQSALQIGSPSKVFHEMGEQVAQGFINGVDGMTKDIQATANVFATPAHALTSGPRAITGSQTSSSPAPVPGATTTFAEGAVQITGVLDSYKAALLAVNGIAERVAL
jgi:tape measure domain-containing protein